MLLRKDVLLLISLLILGTLGQGCASLGRSMPTQVVAQNAAPQPQVPGGPGSAMVPNLRIPAPTVRASSGVLQASATPGQVPKGPNDGPDLNFPSNDPIAQLSELARTAIQEYSKIDSYVARMRRREQVNGRDKPEELLLFKFRKEPFSVYFKWLGNEARGREVVFVKGRYEGKLHTLLAAGDIPLMPAGKRMALFPDSTLVRSSSRHSIEEAGIGQLVAKFNYAVETEARSPQRQSSLTFLGPMHRPEMENDGIGVMQSIPAGAEPQMPKGGKRLWVFDRLSRLPVLLVTQDAAGHEVEYYFYDRVEYPVRLDDDDFNPDKLWGRIR
jgi:hypothetical protein